MIALLDFESTTANPEYRVSCWLADSQYNFYRANGHQGIPSKVLPLVTHVIVSGGPMRSDALDHLFNFYIVANIPILGICLGCMSIVRAFGGTLKDADQSQPVVKIDGGGFLGFDAPSEAAAAHREQIYAVSEELEPCLWNVDSQEIVAVRHRRRPIFGCMFHPESPNTTCGNTLLRSFLSL